MGHIEQNSLKSLPICSPKFHLSSSQRETIQSSNLPFPRPRSLGDKWSFSSILDMAPCDWEYGKDNVLPPFRDKPGQNIQTKPPLWDKGVWPTPEAVVQGKNKTLMDGSYKEPLFFFFFPSFKILFLDSYHCYFYFQISQSSHVYFFFINILLTPPTCAMHMHTFWLFLIHSS